MTLPKITTPTHETILPSTKQTVRFRPYRVREEKILLTAAESNNQKDVMVAVLAVLANCIISTDIDIKRLTPADITWLWVQLTSKSVNNVFDIKYVHDTKSYNMTIELDDVTLDYPEELAKNKTVFENITVEFRPLSFHDTIELEDTGMDITSILLKSIKKIYDDESVYDLVDYSKEELVEFIDSWPHSAVADFENFMSNDPKVVYDGFIMVNKKKKSVRLEGLSHFFQLA